jgi:hypothetical protein
VPLIGLPWLLADNRQFALTSIKLYNDLADGADDFDKGLRNNLREGFNRIYIENSVCAPLIASTAAADSLGLR